MPFMPSICRCARAGCAVVAPQSVKATTAFLYELNAPGEKCLALGLPEVSGRRCGGSGRYSITKLRSRSDHEVRMPSRDDERQAESNAPGSHAEGQHGDKTRAKFLENLKGQPPGDTEAADAAEGSRDFDEYGLPVAGRHRLSEERQQHDPAEKNSEANRIGR
jgi:hypothetical protein